MAAPSSKSALTFICLTVLIDTIGFGIIIPVLPDLIMELTGTGVSGASVYGGWLLFLYALLQFFAAPVLGSLSDRFGRRPVLLFSLLAFGADYFLMALAPTIAWLFVGRALAGVFGATFTTANAYIADVTSPENRAKSFGLLGAAWGLGFITGPMLGGLLGEYGARVPFFAAAGVAVLNAVYGFFVLPETLRAEDRRTFEFKRAHPVGALKSMRKYPLVFGLFSAILLYQIAHDANPAVFSFCMIEKFGWTPRQLGMAMGAVGLGIIIVQAGLIGPIIKRIGERNAVYVGFTLFGAGFFGFAFATEGWMIYASIVPLALGGIGTPALRSIMSNQVPSNAQGELHGALTSVMSLTAIFAPLIMTGLFRAFTGRAAPVYFPGAPFLLAGVLLLAATVVCAWLMRGLTSAPVAEGEAGVAAAE